MKNHQTISEYSIPVFIVRFAAGFTVCIYFIVDFNKYFTHIVTIFATFAGAFSAFFLQNKSQKRVSISEKVEAGNQAIFNIVRGGNTFASYKKQFIGPELGTPLNCITIQPSVGFMNLNFDSLTYLIELDDPNLILQLAILQSEVESVVALLQIRDQMHLNEVQPAMEKSNIKQGQNVTPTQIKGILGDKLLICMKDLTEELIKSVDKIIIDSKRLAGELHEIQKRISKGIRF